MEDDLEISEDVEAIDEDETLVAQGEPDAWDMKKNAGG